MRPVGYEDAKGEPDGRCRVATDDVAEVMCAEVDPAEPDEQDQGRKYGNGGPSRNIDPRYPGKQVSQKSIDDERSHGVPAGKTMRRRKRVAEERLRTSAVQRPLQTVFDGKFTRHRDRLWAVALRTLGDREEAAED